MHRSTIWGILALVLLPSAALANPTVVRVKDGDSLVVEDRGRKVEIRLADIDAPEYDQAYGREAGRALRSLVQGRKKDSRAVTGSTRSAKRSSRAPVVRCGAKRYCNQMTSCDEAFAYLRKCGQGQGRRQVRIDGDRDGIPCERRYR